MNAENTSFMATRKCFIVLHLGIFRSGPSVFNLGYLGLKAREKKQKAIQGGTRKQPWFQNTKKWGYLGLKTTE